MTKTPNGFTLDDALAFVRAATPDERKRLAEVLYSYRQDDIQDAKGALVRGDAVVFFPKKRNHPSRVEGKIVAINKKTVTVVSASSGLKWRVRADMVCKLPTAAG